MMTRRARQPDTRQPSPDVVARASPSPSTAGRGTPVATETVKLDKIVKAARLSVNER
jgi:hypothetical protein